MIDFEITVDVSNLSVVEKMRVQDAFFELGIVWYTKGKKHSYLDKHTYTNVYAVYAEDYVDKYLYFSELRLPATHTPEDLFELVKQIKHSKVTSKEAVDMSKNNLKPFNLEAALAGEPVILRNGLKAYVRHRETELESAPLLGFFVRGDAIGIGAWEECGANYWNRRIAKSDYDIVGMWVEPLVFKAISKYMENNEEEREQFKTILQHHKDHISDQIQRLKRQEWVLKLKPAPRRGIIDKYPSETRNLTVEVTRQIKDGPRMSLGGQTTMIIENLPMKLMRKIVDLIEHEYGEN